MPVVDLFCGCGGLSCGFQLAGFDVVAAYDFWEPAVKLYNKNIEGEHASILDLSDAQAAIQAINPYAPTIIIGGPPCQEFSDAGSRIEGEKANLTYIYSEIITGVLPQYFVMENVPRTRSSKAYAKAKQKYIDAGYGLTEVVLDAGRCGVPQKRSRFFCIGSLNATHGFLLGNIFAHYTGAEKSVKDYFSEQGYPLDINAYYRHPTTYERKAIFSVETPSPTIRGVNRPKPATYTRHSRDDVTNEGLPAIRHLTKRERARIQTFPDNFIFEESGISNGGIEQMIGNAVPVQLAAFIAQRLNEYMEGNHLDNESAFVRWLKTSKNYTDRTIGDVFSRINRAKEILPDRPLSRYFITDLEITPQFSELSTDIKSQIRRAIRLRLAFEDETRGAAK